MPGSFAMVVWINSEQKQIRKICYTSKPERKEYYLNGYLETLNFIDNINKCESLFPVFKNYSGILESLKIPQKWRDQIKVFNRKPN
jgi:hypothetical protein